MISQEKLWLRESSRQPAGWKGLSASHLQWHLNEHLQLLNAEPHRLSFHLFCNSCTLFFLEAPEKLNHTKEKSQLWPNNQKLWSEFEMCIKELKGQFTQKFKIHHHLPSCHSKPIWLLRNIKDSWKILNIFAHTIKVNGVQNNTEPPLTFTLWKRTTTKECHTGGRVKDDRTDIFGWTIPLRWFACNTDCSIFSSRTLFFCPSTLL